MASLAAARFFAVAVHATDIAIDSDSTPVWSANVTTGASSNLILTGGANGWFSGDIGGTGSVTVAGAGEWTLAGANTSTGGTRLESGTLALASDSALGAGTLTLSGGTLRPVGSRSLVNSVSLRADTLIAGGDALTLGGVTLNGFDSLNILNNSATGVTIGGAIAENQLSMLIKQGAGELRLTSASSYSGGTFIEAGTVRINNVTGSAFGSGAVTVGSEAVLAGRGRFDGPLSLDGVLAPGNSVGTLTTGSQTWNGGSGLLWEIDAAGGSAGGSPGWDLVAIEGGLTIAASLSDPFTLYLWSLTLGGASGLVGDFNPNLDYSFPFLTSTAGIYGFDPRAFAVDVSGFANTSTGTWSVAQHGGALSLDYTARPTVVPDTAATVMLVAVGLLVLGLARRGGPKTKGFR